MTRISAAAIALTLALAQPVGLSAKGATTRITIRGGALQTPVAITEEGVLRRFEIWAGPGVFVNRVEQTEGFIIDWNSPVTAPPDGLPHYDVAFFVEGQKVSADTPAYVVSYAHDPAAGRGYVYLPGKDDVRFTMNSRAIFHGHGLEGNWFRATQAWMDAIRVLLP